MSRSGTSPQDLQPGDHLGRFEIQAKIGRGGYGHVYRALDPDINSAVAIKVLAANDDVNAVTRFKNEAAAARKLIHPNIITVFELGQEGSTPYLVMEFLDGRDLQHIIDDGTPLSLYQKIRIMVQVADGLHCAHRNGVLHRDIKPANIMVLKDYSVKIMDFGIARLMRDTSTRLTQQGALVGTVLYMAPELFTESGIEVDVLCDIWSYGVLLYELLAGKNPFKTGVMQSEIYRIVTLDLPPIASEAGTPELKDVVDRLLSRPRERRYQTLEDARFALQPILNNLEIIEVDRFLSNARRFLDEERYSQALDAARQARRLDPNHRQAKTIFDLAQQKLEVSEHQKRIDDLVGGANEQVRVGSLSEAIHRLESAPKPLRNDPRVLSLLQELQTIESNRGEAASLVEQAAKALEGNRLTEARDLVGKALKLSPDCEDARNLRDQVQVEFQKLEDDRNYAAEIRKFDRHITFGELKQAEALLSEIESRYPGRALTDDRRAKLKDRINLQKLWQGLVRARELLLNQDFGKAIEVLESLRSAFPGDLEVHDLLNLALKEHDERKKNDDIQQICQAAKEQCGGQYFDESIRLVEQGLHKYPDDPTLIHLLRFIRDAERTFNRDRSLQEALQQIKALSVHDQYQEILDLFGKLPTEIQGNREFRELVSAASKKKDLADRSTGIATACDQGRKLLGEHDFDGAVKVIESAMSQFGHDHELEQLLDTIKKTKAADIERRKVEVAIGNARWLESRGDMTHALKTIDDELLHSPDSSELKSEKARLQAKNQHNVKISELETVIRSALARKAWRDAEDRLKEAVTSFPSESLFLRLREEIPRLRTEHIGQLIDESRKLLDAGRLADAEQFLMAHLVEYKSVPEVQSLARDVAAAKSRKGIVAECLHKAQEREQNDDLPGALDVFRKGLEQYRDDPSLLSAQNRLIDLIEAAKHEKSLTEIEQALGYGDWEQALRLLDQARMQYPNDPALIPSEARAVELRRAFLEGAAAAIRASVKDKNFADARELFQKTLSRHKDQNITGEVLAEIEAGEALYAKEREKRAWIADNLRQAAVCESEGNYSQARSLLQKAIKKYPAEPGLESALALLDAADRKRALAAKTANIQKDLVQGNWHGAMKHLEEARLAFPENSLEFSAFESQARAARAEELQRWIYTANESLNSGNLADVDKILATQLAQFGNEPAVLALKREKARLSLVQTAGARISAGSFDKAETVINELAQLYPGDTDVVRLRADLTAAREQERKERLYREGRAEATKLVKGRKHTQAIARFDSLLAQFPGDRQLQEDLENARDAERRRTLQVEARKTGSSFPLKRWSIYGIAGVIVAALIGFGVLYIPRPKPQVFKVTPESLTLQYQPGVPMEPQIITVTGPADIGDPLKDSDWISFTRGKFDGTATQFAVRIASEALSPGTHVGELRFANQKSVRVAVNVPAPQPGPGKLEVSPTHLTFQYSPTGIAPKTIIASGSNDIPDPRASQGWVAAAPKKRVPGRIEYSVIISPSGLVAGKMNTAELVFAPGVGVSVDVSVPPLEISVQPTSLLFPQGGARQTITITSPGYVNEPRHPDWIRMTRSPSGARGTTVYTVETSIIGLEPDKIQRTDLYFSAQAKVHVELMPPKASSLQPSPLALSPASLTFTWDRAHPPQSRTFRASGPLLAQISDPKKNNNAPWLTFIRGATGANWVEYTVQVAVDLPAGPHSEDLIFPESKKVHVDYEVFDLPEPYPTPFTDIEWSGEPLGPGDELRIKGSFASKGRLQGKLPTYNGLVKSTTNNLSIVQQPSQGNNFRLVVKNNSNDSMKSFSVTWTKQ